MISNYRMGMKSSQLYKDLYVLVQGGLHVKKEKLLNLTEGNLVRAFMIPKYRMGFNIRQLYKKTVYVIYAGYEIYDPFPSSL